MNCNIKQQIKNVCNEDYGFFFDKPNVVGIALGNKYIKGINTCEPALHVYVTKKIPRNCLCSNSLIPILYKGVKTDVIETGPFMSSGSLNRCSCLSYKCSNLNSNINDLPFIKRVRPIQPGYAISTIIEDSNDGTFGYIVLDNTHTTDTYCILSTNEVLANINIAPIGTSIVQTARSFGGQAPQDTVAALLRFTELKFSDTSPRRPEDFNTVDAAVARLVNRGEVNLINPHIPDIGIPTGITTPLVEQRIQWTGCINGYQRGIIASTNAHIKVDYDGKNAYFRDVMVSTGTVSLGDLGALIVDENRRAVGLLFNIIPGLNLNLICRIQNILQSLNVTLLTL